MHPIHPATTAASTFGPKRLGKRWRAAIAAWGLLVLIGTVELWKYTLTPGPQPTAATTLPADLPFARGDGRFTLLMAIHPRCACSRATLSELEVLLTNTGDHLRTTLLFCTPTDLHQDPSTTDLWTQASAIQGIKLVRDDNGRFAEMLGASTSGEAFLYDSSGVLRFNGGITFARGHAGKSDGREAIEAIVHRIQPSTPKTPVFGCTLR